jgi:hypothetical protein
MGLGRYLTVIGAAATISSAAVAAPNLVLNGNFASTSTTSANGNFQVTANNTYGTLNNWTVSNSPTTGALGPYVILFSTTAGANVAQTTSTNQSASNPNSAIPTANNQYGTGQYLAAGYNSTSQEGGNFLALDGDTSVNGYLSQTIGGLTAGAVYELDFDWATAQIQTKTGAVTDQLQVGFGSSTYATNVLSIPSGGFSGWQQVKTFFTATSATQTLSFLSLGSPAGYPPTALLDGVSLTYAPEPSTTAVFATGLIALFLVSRWRRRNKTAT